MVRRILVRSVHVALVLSGIGVAAWVGCAMTPLPWRLMGWMADINTPDAKEPEVIVLLGGGGIPSESGLMRSYAAAEAARVYFSARVVIAVPEDNEDPTAGLMAKELIMRGVAGARLLFEPHGVNTHDQATRIAAMLKRPDGVWDPILIVTSPEHARRAFLCFQHAGFTSIRTSVGWAESLKADLEYDSADLEGRAVDAVGDNMALRYGIWNNMSLQFRLLREFIALGYYRFNGWI